MRSKEKVSSFRNISPDTRLRSRRESFGEHLCAQTDRHTHSHTHIQHMYIQQLSEGPVCCPLWEEEPLHVTAPHHRSSSELSPPPLSPPLFSSSPPSSCPLFISLLVPSSSLFLSSRPPLSSPLLSFSSHLASSWKLATLV